MKPMELQLGKDPAEKVVLPSWIRIPWFAPVGVFAAAFIIGCFYPARWVYQALGFSFCLFVVQGLVVLAMSLSYREFKRRKVEKPSIRIGDAVRDAVCDVWRDFLSLCRGIWMGAVGLLWGVIFLVALCLAIYGMYSLATSVHALLIVAVVLLLMILIKLN